jgi:hypothetical protein
LVAAGAEHALENFLEGREYEVREQRKKLKREQKESIKN